MKRVNADTKNQSYGGIGSDSVCKATGKTWSEWIRVLDKSGCKKMNHPAIVDVVGRHHDGGWWQQMVTVGYEQARGLRKAHEVPGEGYQASTSRVIEVALPRLFSAWSNAAVRSKWLGAVPFEIRKATPKQVMHVTFGKDATSVDVAFYSKGKSKSQVQLTERKMKREKDVERSKAFWSKALEKLKKLVTKPAATGSQRAKGPRASRAERMVEVYSSPNHAQVYLTKATLDNADIRTMISNENAHLAFGEIPMNEFGPRLLVPESQVARALQILKKIRESRDKSGIATRSGSRKRRS